MAEGNRALKIASRGNHRSAEHNDVITDIMKRFVAIFLPFPLIQDTCHCLKAIIPPGATILPMLRSFGHFTLPQYPALLLSHNVSITRGPPKGYPYTAETQLSGNRTLLSLVHLRLPPHETPLAIFKQFAFSNSTATVSLHPSCIGFFKSSHAALLPPKV
jgi:hypothetical protein